MIILCQFLKACYWIINKDGQKRIELKSIDFSQANSIYVTSDNVYTCGYHTPDTINKRACFWINDKITELDVDVTTITSQANSITIKNGVIFTAGSVDNTGCYWINKNKSDFDIFASASIFIDQISSSKHVIYVSGQNNNFQACYCKEKEIIDLQNNGANLSGAYSIYVIGNIIYSAGILESAGIYYACLWKNKELTILPGGRSAYSVFISNEDIYVAGETPGLLACYWKNNKFNLLSTTNSVANSIFLFNDNVYIAGQDSGNACYWINGKQIFLESPSSSNARAIFVKSNN